jgi:hypothetical protein
MEEVKMSNQRFFLDSNDGCPGPPHAEPTIRAEIDDLGAELVEDAGFENENPDPELEEGE